MDKLSVSVGQEQPNQEEVTRKHLNVTSLANDTRTADVLKEAKYRKGPNVTNETDLMAASLDESNHTRVTNLTEKAAVTVTVVEWLTQTPLPTAMVFVNQFGVILSTVIEHVSSIKLDGTTPTIDFSRTSTSPHFSFSSHTASSYPGMGTAEPIELKGEPLDPEDFIQDNADVSPIPSFTPSPSSSSSSISYSSHHSSHHSTFSYDPSETVSTPDLGSYTETPYIEKSSWTLLGTSIMNSAGKAVVTAAGTSVRTSDGTWTSARTSDGTWTTARTSTGAETSTESSAGTYTRPGNGPPTGTVSEGSGFGFTYGPVNPDGTCKVQSQVDEDISMISKEYNLVRLYGTDCDQTAMVLKAAKKRSLRVFAGVSNIATMESELADIAAAAKANGGWDNFDTISIGNELVNFGANPADVVDALLSAKKILREQYKYPSDKAIVSVDTLVAVRDHPEICDNSDYCAVNCHPFFDGGVTYDQSGWFLTTQVATLRPLLKNSKQEIVVTETGWPAYGTSDNGAAVPGACNQLSAISSIKEAFAATPASVIILSAYNDAWKKDNDKTCGAERYWGMFGNAPSGPQVQLPYSYQGCA